MGDHRVVFARRREAEILTEELHLIQDVARATKHCLHIKVCELSCGDLVGFKLLSDFLGGDRAISYIEITQDGELGRLCRDSCFEPTLLPSPVNKQRTIPTNVPSEVVSVPGFLLLLGGSLLFLDPLFLLFLGLPLSKGLELSM